MKSLGRCALQEGWYRVFMKHFFSSVYVINMLSVIKRNRMVRMVLMPLNMVIRYIAIFFYQFSKDSRYVKTLCDKYKGAERCFIIGNGPSLTPHDLDLLKDEITFGSNKIYAMYDKTQWRPTYYICMDTYTVAEIKDTIRRLDGSIKFVANSGGRRADHQYGIYHLMMEPRFVIKKENYVQKKLRQDIHKCFSRTQTVTCTAIEMAIYMGIKEIYLLGCDHTFAVEIKRDGTKVFNSGVQNHFEGGDTSVKNNQFAHIEAFTQCYQVCQDYAKAHGIKIYNCTRGGKLEVFERKSLEDVLRERGV